MKGSWKFWVFSGLFLLVCAAVWLEPTEDDLFELCSTQGKPQIYRSVEADGYYYGTTDDCWNCWIYLKNTDYLFIEFSIAEELPNYMPISGPGVYRVSRIESNSEQCDTKLTSHYKQYESTRKLMEDNNWCFKVERFDNRQARYGEYLEFLGTVKSNPISGSAIGRKRVFWLDHKTDEVIAEYTDFSLNSFPLLRFSSFHTRSHCNSFIEKLGPRGIDQQKVMISPQ
jgi:hypothetical protein